MKEFNKWIEDKELEDFIFELEEIFCSPGVIIEPAGRNCGYGISDEGEQQIRTFLKSKLKGLDRNDT